MKLTNNFSKSEFECSCGCKMPEYVFKNIQELAENLQVLRDELGSLILTNAYRCKDHNADVGGATDSQHLVGKAADIYSPKLSPQQVSDAAEDLMKSEKLYMGGLGRYNTFTHIDIRGYRARWSKTSNN